VRRIAQQKSVSNIALLFVPRNNDLVTPDDALLTLFVGSKGHGAVSNRRHGAV
jgi:hypothetical protein